MALQDFTYFEETVEALQLSSETSVEIASLLANHLSRGLLASLVVTYNKGADCYEFVYRYKNETVEQSLKVTDFIVQLNEGNFTSMTSQSFLDKYSYTGGDIIKPAEETKSAKQSLADFINVYYPSLGITSGDQITSAVLGQILEGLQAWYNAESNVFVIKFCDCGMVNFEGFADIANAFTVPASYMNENTKYILSFCNGAYSEGDINIYPNLFNGIALQQFVGELKKISPAARKKLISIDFRSVKEGSPSAIQASVNDKIWDEFCSDVISLTSITSKSSINK